MLTVVCITVACGAGIVIGYWFGKQEGSDHGEDEKDGRSVD